MFSLFKGRRANSHARLFTFVFSAVNHGKKSLRRSYTSYIRNSEEPQCDDEKTVKLYLITWE